MTLILYLVPTQWSSNLRPTQMDMEQMKNKTMKEVGNRPFSRLQNTAVLLD
jgi:hypothetical protein